MIGKYDYDYYKQHVSIPQVLKKLGYLWDRKKGKGRFLEFVLWDDLNNKELDRLIVSNSDPMRSIAFRRGSTNRADKMDLISLVRNNLDAFPEANGRRNEVDGINRVLASMAGVQNDVSYQVTEAMAIINNTLNPITEAVETKKVAPNGLVEWDMKELVETRPFELGRYERYLGETGKALQFLSSRGISEETVELFKNTYEITKDTLAKKGFRNLSFPYTLTGVAYSPNQPENIQGYEVRGFGKYKGKASGTNSHTACWQAYLGNEANLPNLKNDIRYIHYAESALDIMAYVQINKARLDFEHTLFVSIGGTPSNEQLKGLINAYANAVHVLHFDNDEKGISYDCQLLSVMTDKSFSYSYNKDDENPLINCMYGEKSFSIDYDKFSLKEFIKKAGVTVPNIIVEKPPMKFKDWNDILIEAMQNEKKQPKKEVNERINYQRNLNAQRYETNNGDNVESKGMKR